ncbi:PAS domain S-box protein [Halodesulfurarchaeum sp.]|uniref:PAS domain S-box protein n=1 Tax=Halodesulfurarchaeum sp. TaxID=1980530 RepID=UPI002FC2B535
MGDEWGEVAIESVSAFISDAIFGLDKDGDLIFWNEAASGLFGYTESEAMGSSLKDLFCLNDRDREKINNLLEKSLPGEQVKAPSGSITITATTGSGPSVPIELAVTETDSEALLCVAHPIGEVVNENSYPEAVDNSVFRRAIEGASDLIAAADQNGRLLFANKRYREFHGIEKPVPGQSISNVLPLETHTELKPYFDRVLDGEMVYFEMDRIGADGNKHTFDVRLYPLESATENIHGAVTTMRETTELKERGTSLRESWETYRDLVDGVPHPLLVHHIDGEIVEANEAVCLFLGYSENELLEKNVKDILVSDHADRYIKRAESVTSDRQFFEARLKTAEGTVAPFEVASTTIEYFGNEAILSIARDLSEYKAYKRELEETNARLEEFAAVVSEDLRNPLTVAQGWADIAQEKTGVESLDRVTESLDRMDDVINYTLTLAREGEGLGDLSEINLSKLVTQCWHSVDTNGATLENNAELTIRGDLGRVGHLIETLFQNFETISNGDLGIKIGDLDYRDGFYITTSGPEFPAITQRGPKQSAHIGGADKSECDLTVIRRIAQAHGWRLQLDSREEGGMTFEFSNVDVVSHDQTS